MARKQKQWEVADKNIEGQYIQIQYIQKHRWTMATGNSRRIQIRIYSRHFLMGWLVELVSFYTGFHLYAGWTKINGGPL